MIEVPLSVKADDEIKFLPPKFTLYERVLVRRTFGMNTCWFYAHALSILKREKHAKGGLGGSVETYLWQPGRIRRRDAPCAMCREAASVKKVEQTTPQAD